MQGLRKTTKIPSQNSWFPVVDLNRVPLEYKSGALHTLLWLIVLEEDNMQPIASYCIEMLCDVTWGLFEIFM
jgi:hypothetical protein